MLAGLGAGFGVVIFRAILILFDSKHASGEHDALELVFEFGVLALFVGSFMRPVEERLQELIASAFGERRPAVFQAVRIALLGLPLVLELLLHRVPTGRTIADLAIGVASAGLMTFAWLAGNGRFRLGSTVFGAAMGLFVGLFAVSAIWWLRGGALFDPVSVSYVATSFGRMLDVALGNALTLWLIVGLAGGLVLDLTADRKTAVIAAMATATAALAAVDYLLGSPIWQLNLAMMVGWSVALILPPHFLHALSGSGERSATSVATLD